ncbi:hypothetical protein VPH35_054697 [Triticum aestivum]
MFSAAPAPGKWPRMLTQQSRCIGGVWDPSGASCSCGCSVYGVGVPPVKSGLASLFCSICVCSLYGRRATTALCLLDGCCCGCTWMAVVVAVLGWLHVLLLNVCVCF